jgi:thiosulfate/3-mercaptopyruvate sulfurtransferase
MTMTITLDRRGWLVAGAATLGAAVVTAQSAAAAQAVDATSARITAAALAAMLGDPSLRVVDVRPNPRYEHAHIPGAVSLPADAVIDPHAHVEGAMLPEATLAAMFGRLGIGRATRVVLYDDQGGFHAGRLFWMLEYLGHRHAAVLEGGMPRWQAEGRQLTRELPRIVAQPFVPTIIERRAASADWILDRRDDPNVVLIDVRPPERYRAGHIPWARSIPWKLSLTADGMLKPEAELRAHFALHGVMPERNIATHCQDGKASGHTYWTLRALGFPRVRSYDRSWAEWGSDPALPKAVARG